jgi:hypothetical protein
VAVLDCTFNACWSPITSLLFNDVLSVAAVTCPRVVVKDVKERALSPLRVISPHYLHRPAKITTSCCVTLLRINLAGGSDQNYRLPIERALWDRLVAMGLAERLVALGLAERLVAMGLAERLVAMGLAERLANPEKLYIQK